MCAQGFQSILFSAICFYGLFQLYLKLRMMLMPVSSYLLFSLKKEKIRKRLICFPLQRFQVSAWLSFHMVVQIGSFFNCFYILYYSSAQLPNLNSAQTNPWWENGKIKMQLAKIYHAKGKLEDFVDTIYSYVRETLVIEIMNRKVLF